MSFLGDAFNTILYRPLLNALIILYNYLPGNDFGIAIIVLTLLIRFLLYPLGSKAIRSQKILTELQPKMKEIQDKYKNDKEKQAKEMMALYQREKINPLSGCLPILIQLPLLVALYRVFWKGLRPAELSSVLYSFTPHIDAINSSFLGLIDLSKSASIAVDGVSKILWPNVILLVLVGIAQFWQMRMTTLKKSKTNSSNQLSNLMQKQMLYFFPIFIIFTLWKLPSALALYWLTTTIFSITQQHILFKKKTLI